MRITSSSQGHRPGGGVMGNWILADQETSDDVLKMVLNMAEYIDVPNTEEVEVGLGIIAEAMRRLMAQGEVK